MLIEFNINIIKTNKHFNTKKIVVTTNRSHKGQNYFTFQNYHPPCQWGFDSLYNQTQTLLPLTHIKKLCENVMSSNTCFYHLCFTFDSF